MSRPLGAHADMKLVILDRDGVINEDADTYVKSPEEWIPIPGSLEAIARLNHSGYRVVVASNQSGLARGLFTIDDLNNMHRRMHQELARLGGQIDAVFFCPHGPQDACRCRKPSPGLFEQIGLRLRQDLRNAPSVGDSFRDIQAARAAGALPVSPSTDHPRSVLHPGCSGPVSSLCNRDWAKHCRFHSPQSRSWKIGHPR